MNHRYYAHGQAAAASCLGLSKLAMSRIDREVALGNVGYHEAVPGMSEALGKSPRFGKAFARQHFGDIARDQTPAAKARIESLDDRAFKNDHLRQDVINRAEKFDKERQGIRSMFGDADGLGDTPLQGPSMADAPHIKHWKDQYEGQLIPNFHAIGPATEPDMGGKPKIFVPEESGQFMRAANEAKNKEDYKTLGRAAGHPLLDNSDYSVLPARKGVDRTINRGILQHEKGEARAMGSAMQYPHASHLDVTPLLEEDMLYSRNPEAYDLAKSLRNKKRSRDDALLWKLKKQVGYHPNSPLPIEGKQTDALRKLLADNEHLLSPKTRYSNLQRQAMNEYRYQHELRDAAKATGAGLNRAAPVRKVMNTLPKDVINRMESAVPRAMENYDNFRAAKGPLEGLKAVGRGLKSSGPDLWNTLKGMRT